MTDAKAYPTKSLHALLDGPSDIDWILPGIVAEHSFGLLAGVSGIGKSWLFMDLALATATGGKWLGHFPVKQGTVLMVDEENAEILLRNRINKMLKYRGITDTKDVPLHFAVGTGAGFSPTVNRDGETTPSPEYRRLLQTAIECKPALTLFDSLIRLHRARENASEEISIVFNFIMQFCRDANTTAMLAHHLRKAYGNGNGGANSGERIRGSSDIVGACDYTVIVDPSEKGLIVTHEKARWDERIKPFKVKFIIDKAKGSLGLEYAGEVGIDLDPWEWLQLFLTKEKATIQSGAIIRQTIIERAEAEDVCKSRTMDTVLSEHREAGHLGRIMQGKDAAYWLKKPIKSPNGKVHATLH